MDVLVFKTSVTTKTQALEVGPLLTTMPYVKQYNFDLEDCDNILRIVGHNLNPRDITSLLQTAGFTCDELDD